MGSAEARVGFWVLGAWCAFCEVGGHDGIEG